MRVEKYIWRFNVCTIKTEHESRDKVSTHDKKGNVKAPIVITQWRCQDLRTGRTGLQQGLRQYGRA